MNKPLLAGLIAISCTFGLTGCAQSLAMQNLQACTDASVKLDSFGTAFSYMKADITAQNMTGVYDFEGLGRQAATLKGMVDELMSISGTPEFDNARTDLAVSLNSFLNMMTDVANRVPDAANNAQTLESNAINAITAFADFCEG